MKVSTKGRTPGGFLKRRVAGGIVLGIGVLLLAASGAYYGYGVVADSKLDDLSFRAARPSPAGGISPGEQPGEGAATTVAGPAPAGGAASVEPLPAQLPATQGSAGFTLWSAGFESPASASAQPEKGKAALDGAPGQQLGLEDETGVIPVPATGRGLPNGEATSAGPSAPPPGDPRVGSDDEQTLDVKGPLLLKTGYARSSDVDGGYDELAVPRAAVEGEGGGAAGTSDEPARATQSVEVGPDANGAGPGGTAEAGEAAELTETGADLIRAIASALREDTGSADPTAALAPREEVDASGYQAYSMSASLPSDQVEDIRAESARQSAMISAEPGSPGPALRMTIPAIEVDSVVTELKIISLNDSAAWETPVKVVGHIPTTAVPGAEGQGWYFGHLESPIKGLGNVFRRLPEIPGLLYEGETVQIFLEVDGRTYVYQVYKTTWVSQERLKITDSGLNDITLVTCWPRFYYDKRVLVTAALVDVLETLVTGDLSDSTG